MSASDKKNQSLKRQELLLKILKSKADGNKLQVGLADRKQALPLSWGQQQLWFISQLSHHASRAYHVPFILRLRGGLDNVALKNAFSTLVIRHEILRTNILVNEKGEPYQQVKTGSDFCIESHSLAETLGEQEKLNAYKALIEEIVSAPFDLAKDSLIRVALIKRGLHDHSLVLVLHHIITDAWSMDILIRDLSSLYGAFRKGLGNPLKELAVQYGDYAVWQRNWLQGEVLDRESAYWRRKLKNVPLLELPADRPRPPTQSYKGSRSALHIDAELSQSLKVLGKRHGCTMFMVLLACFKVLLHRYTQKTDLCVGTPTANRLHSDIEPLIGFFANTLALRTEVNNQQSFVKFLKQIKEVTLSAYEHQTLPFERVVEAVQPERSQAHSPLFQVMLVFQSAHVAELDMPGLTFEYESIECSTSMFDLTLILEEMPDGRLEGGIEYAADLFNESTIERFKTHFVSLLKSIVAEPEKTLSELEYLGTQEKHHLLVEWNDTATRYATDKCIHHLFEEQVERTPDAIAVVYEDQQLSYRELNARANQLAHYLIEQGVGPEVKVGICVERSLEMVVGILGILKAGGCYVPLDPDYPPARLAYIMEDADLETVLTQQHVQAKARINGAHAVCLDDEFIRQNLVERPISNPGLKQRGIASSDLAYVIYTSGSTGMPKGVMVGHHSILNLGFNIQGMDLSVAGGKWGWVASYTFDASVQGITQLILGQTLVIISDECKRDPSLLAPLLPSLDVLDCTPKMVEAWFASRIEDQLPNLIIGGEAIDPKLWGLLVQWQARYGKKAINVYGPTECTVDSSGCVITGPLPNIGKPLFNTKAYVLNDALVLTGKGVPGELYIGGVGLARGYLNRPDLTAEKFVPNPFSETPGERLYRTGDLVRYLPDGNIEFLGRIDHQVKIRGFRIELGEIEHALLSQLEVKEAVVVAHAREGGDKYLVAYVVPAPLSDGPGRVALDCDRLRQALKASLPEYMIPSYFMELEALPLTPNGKVDRKALLPPDVSQIQTKEYVAPRTELERRLVSIWAEVLKLPEEKIGIQDNFFELGGHSLLVVQVAARLRSRMALELPIVMLFDSPAIRELAASIERLRENQAVLGFSFDSNENNVHEILL